MPPLVLMAVPAAVMRGCGGVQNGEFAAVNDTTARTPARVTLLSEVKVSTSDDWVPTTAAGAPAPLRTNTCGERVDGPSNTRTKSKLASVSKVWKVMMGCWPSLLRLWHSCSGLRAPCWLVCWLSSSSWQPP